ncbi:ABC transporter ATP-binding protein [Micromonospora sp. NPDC047074]|uniref:ABC transporter ATP-binding protein n=1 Tax=Micromonospora sp. NPDC047074 TaxID=3154339 RepID=UPI0033CE3403
MNGTVADGTRAAAGGPDSSAILAAESVSVFFAAGRRSLAAVLDVSLAVHAGETVALVGESGSGKSTLALALMRARELRQGRLLFRGRDITRQRESRLEDYRRQVQMVFQDPHSSLDPRMTVGRILAEPLRAHRIGDHAQRDERIRQLLADVGLGEDVLERRPAQFSGGQRQRIAIARALALDPRLVIADEPVSALDVSVQAQIVQLLRALQREHDMAYLLVSHDLPLVHHLATRVAVMYLGRIVESGPVDEVVRRPRHPYTAALLAAAPSIDRPGGRERIVLTGSPPSPMARPTGCEFHPRCPVARDRCRTEAPVFEIVTPGRGAACFYPGELPGIDVSSTSARAEEHV